MKRFARARTHTADTHTTAHSRATSEQRWRDLKINIKQQQRRWRQNERNTGCVSARARSWCTSKTKRKRINAHILSKVVSSVVRVQWAVRWQSDQDRKELRSRNSGDGVLNMFAAANRHTLWHNHIDRRRDGMCLRTARMRRISINAIILMGVLDAHVCACMCVCVRVSEWVCRPCYSFVCLELTAREE